MSTPIVEVDTFSASVVVPVTGEDVTAAALTVPVQSLTNRTKNLNTRVTANEAWIAAPDFPDAVVITVGAVTSSVYGIKNIAVPANATTTIATLAGWPANRSVGHLRCRLVSYVATNSDTGHFGVQCTNYTIRRAPSTFASQETIIEDVSTGVTVDHALSVADSSGDTLIKVVSGAGSSACACSLIVEIFDGTTWVII